MNLIDRTIDMRKDILKMSLNCGKMGAHLGGSLSCVDILAVLFTEKMHHEGENRDRFIMSKAHSAMALYAALKQVGKIKEDDIQEAMKKGSFLFKHPKINIPKGIEFSGGSLGQGLSLGVGTALAIKIKGIAARTYVLVGDGECDEGSVWEAAMSASHYNLNNLVVIVDRNGLQNDGTTDDIMNLQNMQMKWNAFGFDTYCINGHDIEQIRDALSKESLCHPIAIIANTIKGKGVSFAENVVEWHASFLTQDLYEKAMEEVERGRV